MTSRSDPPRLRLHSEGEATEGCLHCELGETVRSWMNKQPAGGLDAVELIGDVLSVAAQLVVSLPQYGPKTHAEAVGLLDRLLGEERAKFLISHPDRARGRPCKHLNQRQGDPATAMRGRAWCADCGEEL